MNLLLATTSSIRKTTPQKEKLYFVKLAILEAKIQDYLFRKAKTSSHNSTYFQNRKIEISRLPGKQRRYIYTK